MKSEVLRYLGYKNQEISAELSEKLDFLISDIPKNLTPKMVWEVFEPDFNENISLKNTTLELKGKSIGDHLQNAEKVAVMAVTLGIEAERLILKYQHLNMVDALICDAVLDSLVEKAADDCEEKIKDYAKENNLFTNFRFSPGYGDLPLDTQKTLIATLNAEKRIGITVTESNILLPRKSVTAVVGLFKDKPLNKPHSCENCNMKDKCNSKKECIKNV